MRDSKDSIRYKKILAFLKFALLIGLIIGTPVFLYLKFGAEIFSKDAGDRILDYLVANEGIASFLIIGIQALQVIICILPGQPIQFASSYMFGVTRGLILSLIGAVIGTTISFVLSKLLGKDLLKIIIDEDRLEDYKRKLNSGKGILIVALIYLIPGVPKDLVSYAAGISDMKYKPFIVITTIARSPGMLGSLLLGHFYGKQDYTAILILSALVGIILLICFIKRDEIIHKLDSLEKDR